jgi:hypothetical protein
MPGHDNMGRQKMRRYSRMQHARTDGPEQPDERAREVGAPDRAAKRGSAGKGGANASFDAGAGRGVAEDAGVRLGIGVGGVSEIRGGSTGDRDLSGRRGSELDALEDIVGTDDTTVGPGSDVGATGAVSVSGKDRTTSTGFGFGGDVDIADLGRDAGVIDTTRDPIGGTGDEDEGMDESDDMIQGEVGAQAERDLTELLGEHIHDRRDPADTRLQQGLTELIEEDDDEDEAQDNRR